MGWRRIFFRTEEIRSPLTWKVMHSSVHIIRERSPDLDRHYARLFSFCAILIILPILSKRPCPSIVNPVIPSNLLSPLRRPFFTQNFTVMAMVRKLDRSAK